MKEKIQILADKKTKSIITIFENDCIVHVFYKYRKTFEFAYIFETVMQQCMCLAWDVVKTGEVFNNQNLEEYVEEQMLMLAILLQMRSKQKT